MEKQNVQNIFSLWWKPYITSQTSADYFFQQWKLAVIQIQFFGKRTETKLSEKKQEFLQWYYFHFSGEAGRKSSSNLSIQVQNSSWMMKNTTDGSF